jgi:hypothetical protein
MSIFGRNRQPRPLDATLLHTEFGFNRSQLGFKLVIFLL